MAQSSCSSGGSLRARQSGSPSTHHFSENISIGEFMHPTAPFWNAANAFQFPPLSRRGTSQRHPIKGRESKGEVTARSLLLLSLLSLVLAPSPFLTTPHFPTMSGPHTPLPTFAFLDAAGGLGGGGGGGDDKPRRRHLPSTHAVEANPVFPDEDNPNTSHGDHSDPASAAFPGAVPSRKKKRGENLVPCRCPVCGKRFSHPKALHGHMRCHPDRTWRGITPPVREEEAAASQARLSSGEGARAKRYVCSRCGSGFETRQGLGGHRASHKSVQGCHARSLEGRKGSGVHGARNVRRGSGDEGGKQVRIGQKRSSSGRWRASKEAQTAEAAAKRRGLLPDLNLPVSPEDTEDGSSSGIIDLNKKLPGQDDE